MLRIIPWQLEVDCGTHCNIMGEEVNLNTASDVGLTHDNLK